MFSEKFKQRESNDSSMEWIELKETGQIEEIISESQEQPILIFKHSVRCGTSAMALDRLQRSWDNSEMGTLKTYFLDLIRYREVSNEVAHRFEVWHQSPQILIIYQGTCVYDTSHMGISYQDVRSTVSEIETA